MKNGYDTHLKIRRGPVKVLVLILLLVLLTQVLGDNQRTQPLRSRTLPEVYKKRIARRLASSYGLGPFQPSLEMKENADFFLTPALLVQEAISDDIVITYPTE